MIASKLKSGERCGSQGGHSSWTNSPSALGQDQALNRDASPSCEDILYYGNTSILRFCQKGNLNRTSVPHMSLT